MESVSLTKIVFLIPSITHQAVQDISVAKFEYLIGFDLKLYEYATKVFPEAEFSQRILKLINNLKWLKSDALIQKKKELDEIYEKAIYHSNLPAINNINIDLTEMFIGTGWGIAEQNIHGHKWRWLGPEGISNLYLKLNINQNYLLKSLIHAAKGDSQERFHVYINNESAQNQRIVTEASQRVFHNCIIPKETLSQNKGWIKITYKVENPIEETFQVTENMPFKPAEVALTLVQCNGI
jgi:hypothetical protein